MTKTYLEDAFYTGLLAFGIMDFFFLNVSLANWIKFFFIWLIVCVVFCRKF